MPWQCKPPLVAWLDCPPLARITPHESPPDIMKEKNLESFEEYVFFPSTSFLWTNPPVKVQKLREVIWHKAQRLQSHYVILANTSGQTLTLESGVKALFWTGSE